VSVPPLSDLRTQVTGAVSENTALQSCCTLRGQSHLPMRSTSDSAADKPAIRSPSTMSYSSSFR
jgi:hypothetical protein